MRARICVSCSTQDEDGHRCAGVATAPPLSVMLFPRLRLLYGTGWRTSPAISFFPSSVAAWQTLLRQPLAACRAPTLLLPSLYLCAFRHPATWAPSWFSHSCTLAPSLPYPLHAPVPRGTRQTRPAAFKGAALLFLTLLPIGGRQFHLLRTCAGLRYHYMAGMHLQNIFTSSAAAWKTSLSAPSHIPSASLTGMLPLHFPRDTSRHLAGLPAPHTPLPSAVCTLGDVRMWLQRGTLRAYARPDQAFCIAFYRFLSTRHGRTSGSWLRVMCLRRVLTKRGDAFCLAPPFPFREFHFFARVSGDSIWRAVLLTHPLSAF